MLQKNIAKLVIFVFIIFFLFPKNLFATIKNNNTVNIYFFHSETCSHCKREIKLLDYFETVYSQVKIYKYEIHNEDNQKILEQVKKIYQIKGNSVPVTIIGNKVYSGYSEEKSKLKFIKTIEYYSRYGYEDKIGEYLNFDEKLLPQSNMSNNQKTVDEFINTYGNYRLVGSIYTDDLDVSTIAILLGMLSQINIISICSIMLIFIFIKKINSLKFKVLLLAYYLLVFLALEIVYIFSNQLLIMIISILLIAGFFIVYLIQRNKSWLQFSLFTLLLLICICLGNIFSSKYFYIFNNILAIYKLFGIEKILYYSNYIFVWFIIYIIIFIFLYLIILLCNKVNIKNVYNKR